MSSKKTKLSKYATENMPSVDENIPSNVHSIKTKIPSKTKPSKTKPSEKTPKRTSTTFILKNISAVQTILSTFAFSTKLLDMMNDNQDCIPQTLLSGDEVDKITDIPVVDLLHEKSKRAYYFLDTRKIQNKFWGVMIDITLNGPLPNTIQKPCWWCKHKFSSKPIGCPLKYHPHKTSGIEKDRFEEKMKAVGLPTTTNDFFETEGLFCSFPCCKAFILDQKGSVKYKESLTLLSLLFSILYSTEKHPIGIFSADNLLSITTKKNKKSTLIPHKTLPLETTDFPTAPSWKLLKDYGGHLTIEEWRSTFGKLEYDLTVNVRRPYMYCSSQYISEKKIKLFKGMCD